METFDYFWQLLETHGVVPNRRIEAANLWSRYSLEQQRYIYRRVRDKIREGKFVHFDPILAIRENSPKRLVISYQAYVSRYGTDLPKDGWVRKHLADQQKTIFIKLI